MRTEVPLSTFQDRYQFVPHQRYYFRPSGLKTSTSRGGATTESLSQQMVPFVAEPYHLTHSDKKLHYIFQVFLAVLALDRLLIAHRVPLTF